MVWWTRVRVVRVRRWHSYSLRTGLNTHHKWQKKIWNILWSNFEWRVGLRSVWRGLGKKSLSVIKYKECPTTSGIVWQINNRQWQWGHTATSASKTKELFYWTIDLFVLFLFLSGRIFTISMAISNDGNADGIIYLLPMNSSLADITRILINNKIYLFRSIFSHSRISIRTLWIVMVIDSNSRNNAFAGRGGGDGGHEQANEGASVDGHIEQININSRSYLDTWWSHVLHKYFINILMDSGA